MSVEQEVIDIIVEQLGVDRDEVNAEKSFVEDLNADSLDLTELIMTFEEKFGFEKNLLIESKNSFPTGCGIASSARWR